MPQTDAAEIARLLGPFAEAVGGALAVFGVDGSEIVSVGDGPLARFWQGPKPDAPGAWPYEGDWLTDIRKIGAENYSEPWRP